MKHFSRNHEWAALGLRSASLQQQLWVFPGVARVAVWIEWSVLWKPHGIFPWESWTKAGEVWHSRNNKELNITRKGDGIDETGSEPQVTWWPFSMESWCGLRGADLEPSSSLFSKHLFSIGGKALQGHRAPCRTAHVLHSQSVHTAHRQLLSKAWWSSQATAICFKMSKAGLSPSFIFFFWLWIGLCVHSRWLADEAQIHPVFGEKNYSKKDCYSNLIRFSIFS